MLLPGKQTIGTPRRTPTLRLRSSVLDRPAPAPSNPPLLPLVPILVGLLQRTTDSRLRSRTRDICPLHLLLLHLPCLRRTHLRTPLTFRSAPPSRHTRLPSSHRLRSLPHRQTHTLPIRHIPTTPETRLQTMNRLGTRSHDRRRSGPATPELPCHLSASSLPRASVPNLLANSALQTLTPISRWPNLRLPAHPHRPQTPFHCFHPFRLCLAVNTSTTCPAAWSRIRIRRWSRAGGLSTKYPGKNWPNDPTTNRLGSMSGHFTTACVRIQRCIQACTANCRWPVSSLGKPVTKWHINEPTGGWP